MIGYIIGGVLLAFILVLVIRACLFRPHPLPKERELPVEIPRDKVVQDMVDLIRCKTVSNRDEALVDRAEFEKLRSLLAERFPTVHKKAVRKELGKTGLLYIIKGKSSDRPNVLMAHYDVVPVEEALWTKPAFAGLIEEDCIWGRGTLDTKGTLCGIFEALEVLLNKGYEPANDLYLSFSGEEEIDGDSCPAIVTYLEENGIRPAMVLDEGGAVVEKVFPGVSGECALIGIAEKGSVNMEFRMDSTGGHASTPPVHTVLGRLSSAVCRSEAHPFRRRLTRPVAEMFDTLGRYSTFAYKLIFANLWCFEGLLDKICKKSGGELNAMMRTTVAVTRMEGSKAYNVLPPKASFGINMRLMPGDTIDSATEYLRKVIADDSISIHLVNGMNPSPCARTDGEAWTGLSEVVHATWPEAIVSPYLMMACSDSRHYCRICDHVYRFSAMRMSKAERGMIHGNDERIPIETLLTTVAFYERLLQTL